MGDVELLSLGEPSHSEGDIVVSVSNSKPEVTLQIEATQGEMQTNTEITSLPTHQRFLGQSFRMPLESRGSNHPWYSLLCLVSSFSGMILVSVIFLDFASDALLCASLGATSVLLYGAPSSPLAQPRNVLIGNIIASVVGVAMRYAFEGHAHLNWVASALAVSLTIFLMDVTNTTHPPAGATSVLPIIGTQAMKDLGFLFIVYPVLISEVILILVALLFNNLFTYQRYPLYWV